MEAAMPAWTYIAVFSLSFFDFICFFTYNFVSDLIAKVLHTTLCANQIVLMKFVLKNYPSKKLIGKGYTKSCAQKSYTAIL